MDGDGWGDNAVTVEACADPGGGWALTCEEDGVHLVCEQRDDLVVVHTSGSSAAFVEVSDRPLPSSPAPASAVDWSVPVLGLRADATDETRWDPSGCVDVVATSITGL